MTNTIRKTAFLVLFILVTAGPLFGFGKKEEIPAEPEVTEPESSETEEPLSEAEEDTLFSLVQKNDAEALQSLFSVKVDINEKDSSGRTPLHLAVLNNAPSIVTLFIAQGANINVMDNDGKTPLHYAVSTENSEICQVLSSAGADIFLEDLDGMSPLMLAIETKPVLAEAMVNKNNMNEKFYNGGNVLHLAAEQKLPQQVLAFLKMGASVREKDNSGMMPIDLALDDKASRDGALAARYLIQYQSIRPVDPHYSYIYKVFNDTNINVLYDGGYTALHYAAEEGHEGILRLLIEEGINIEARDESGGTPLFLAVRNGFTSLVKILIEEGADVNTFDYSQNTPLHTALLPMTVSADIIEALLEKGANVNAKNSLGNTPLHMTIELGVDVEIVKLLLWNAADYNVRNKAGNTPLLEAVRKKNIDIANELLETGSDIFATNNVGQTPASTAISQGEETLAWFFNGRNILFADNNGNSPLHLAIQMGSSLDIVMQLADMKAKLDARNYRGNTPLHEAVNTDSIEICNFLLSRGADLYLTNNEGKSPLTIAFSKGVDFVEAFLPETHIDKADRLGNTPLFFAIQAEKPDIVSLLIEKGASLDAKNINGSTSLHEAVKVSQVITERLVKNGADVFAVDNMGNTPLHEAAYWNAKENVKFLLDNRANINAKNYNGYTPFHKAVSEGNIEMAMLLISLGASLESSDNSGRTPIFTAVIEDHVDMAKTLIQNGADLTKRDAQGNTVLHEAVRAGNAETAKLLLNEDMDIFQRNKHSESPLILAFDQGSIVTDWFLTPQNINSMDDDGNTPMHIAVEMGLETSMVQLLLEKGADRFARNSQGDTPDMIASRLGYVETAEILKN